METIAVNPERRDPGFLENKFDVGLGRVDNISSSELIDIIVESASTISNEKTIGEEIQTRGETFLPIFETAQNSSTCSLEVGFYKEDETTEIASFNITFSYYEDSISYFLNVASGIDEIENLYLRICKKDNKLIGGIYWQDDSYYSSDNFKRIGVNLITWTPGSRILDPSYNKISLYNTSNSSSNCTLIIDIPLDESTSTVEGSASSFVIYDSATGRRIVDSETNYSSEQLNSLDVPTINEVPFLLKRGTLIDGKYDGRHITIPANHKSSHVEDAGKHDWDVLDRIRKAGLIQDANGATHTIGEFQNDDDLHYGVTRLSGYGEIGSTSITINKLNSWLDTLGIDTDVISVGLFKNFVGYLERIIDNTYEPTVYDFSLNDSSKDFIYVTSMGSEDGIEVIFNSYKKSYTGSGGTTTGVSGSSSLMNYTLVDADNIIEEVSLTQLDTTKIKALIKIAKNNIEKSKKATITFKQLEGNTETALPNIDINIFQEGFLIKYGYLFGDSEVEESMTPHFGNDALKISSTSSPLEIQKYIKPIVSENTELGYRVLTEGVTTSLIMDLKSKSWSTVELNNGGNGIFITATKNTRPSTRTASGYLALYDENRLILDQIPISITQGATVGTLTLNQSEFTSVKSGSDIKITVTSNYQWTIDIETVPSWITLVGFDGSMKEGTKTITASISPNGDLDREANIVFINVYGSTATAHIFQSGKVNYLDIVGIPDSDAFLSMSPSFSPSVNLGRDVVEIYFKTDLTWFIDYKPTWIGIDYTSGSPSSNIQKITLRLDHNDDSWKYVNECGDYISFGYFDTDQNAIISVRKIYIDLRTWGPAVSRSGYSNMYYSDGKMGSYFYGAIRNNVYQGDTVDIYCIGDTYTGTEVIGESQVNQPFRTELTRNINNPIPEFEFINPGIGGQKWTKITKYNSSINKIGIWYPDLSQWSQGFGHYKLVLKATQHFDQNTISLFDNSESSSSQFNMFTLVTRKPTASNILIGIPDSKPYLEQYDIIYRNDVAKLKLRRLMKYGINLRVLDEQSNEIEINSENGIQLNGEEQKIIIESSKKYSDQPFSNMTLMNKSLPGWLYFDERLTAEDNIRQLGQFTAESKTYELNFLPNRTGNSRSVQLQFADRQKKDSLTILNITQNPIKYTSYQKRLVGINPILDRNPSYEEDEIGIKALYTWEEDYSIGDSEQKTRTYREISDNYLATLRLGEETSLWAEIITKNFKKSLKLSRNTGSSVRKGSIQIDAIDDYGNQCSGELIIYQPFYDRENNGSSIITKSISNYTISFFDLGSNITNLIPMEIYNIGYKVVGTKTVSYGETTDTYSNIEIFPDSLEDLVVTQEEEDSKQTLDLSVPMSIIRRAPLGVEEISSIKISLFGSNEETLRIYQELNPFPFEIEYSYLRVNANYLENNSIKIGITPINKDVLVTNGGERVSNTDSDRKSNTYLSILDSIKEGQEYRIENNTTINLILGSQDQLYDENFGLSIQKRLINPIVLKEPGLNNPKKIILTVVLDMDSDFPHDRLFVDNSEDPDPETNLEDRFKIARHGTHIPHSLIVEGLNNFYSANDVQRLLDFESTLGTFPGKQSSSLTTIKAQRISDEGWAEDYSYYSHFFAPQYLISAKVQGLEGFDNIIKSYLVKTAPRSKYYDGPGSDYPLNSLHYSSNISYVWNESHTQINKVYLDRIPEEDENYGEYYIYYGGQKFGISVSEVSIEHNIYNDITTISRNDPPSTPRRRAQACLNSEVSVLISSIGNNSDIHGIYPEKYIGHSENEDGSFIKINIYWGGFYGGLNTGKSLAESGEEFKLATITFNAVYYDKDGIRRDVEAPLEVWYKGEDLTSTIIEPSDRTIIIRGYDKDNSRTVKFSSTSGSVPENNKLIKFSTRKNWMLYRTDNNPMTWRFNGVQYSPTWNDSSMNCGYCEDLSTVSLRIDGLNAYLDNRIWTWSGTSISPYSAGTFKLVNTYRVDSSTDWESMTGPELNIMIGPKIPYLTIWDEAEEKKISGESDTLTFGIKPPATNESEAIYTIRANFSLSDFPYGRYPSTFTNLLKTLYMSELGFSPFLVWSSYDESISISTQWRRKLSYIPGEGLFYITIESLPRYPGDEELIYANYYDEEEGSSKGRNFGKFTMTLKDPIGNEDSGGYSLTFTGKCYDDNNELCDLAFNNHLNWDISSDEIVLYSYEPKQIGRHLLQEAYCDHDTTIDGNDGTLPNLYGSNVFFLDTYSDIIIPSEELSIEYSGTDTQFYCVIATEDPWNGEGVRTYSYSPSMTKSVTLTTLRDELVNNDDHRKLLVWLNNKSAGNNAIRVFRLDTETTSQRPYDFDFDDEE